MLRPTSGSALLASQTTLGAARQMLVSLFISGRLSKVDSFRGLQTHNRTLYIDISTEKYILSRRRKYLTTKHVYADILFLYIYIFECIQVRKCPESELLLTSDLLPQASP